MNFSRSLEEEILSSLDALYTLGRKEQFVVDIFVQNRKHVGVGVRKSFSHTMAAQLALHFFFFLKVHRLLGFVREEYIVYYTGNDPIATMKTCSFSVTLQCTTAGYAARSDVSCLRNVAKKTMTTTNSHPVREIVPEDIFCPKL